MQCGLRNRPGALARIPPTWPITAGRVLPPGNARQWEPGQLVISVDHANTLPECSVGDFRHSPRTNRGKESSLRCRSQYFYFQDKPLDDQVGAFAAARNAEQLRISHKPRGVSPVGATFRLRPPGTAAVGMRYGRGPAALRPGSGCGPAALRPRSGHATAAEGSCRSARSTPSADAPRRPPPSVSGCR